MELAVKVAVVVAETPPEFTVKETDFCPKGTETDDGAVAAALLLERETDSPPAPAGPLRVTVPVELPPLLTVLGLKLSETSAAGVIARVAFWEAVLSVAVIAALI